MHAFETLLLSSVEKSMCHSTLSPSIALCDSAVAWLAKQLWLVAEILISFTNDE